MATVSPLPRPVPEAVARAAISPMAGSAIHLSRVSRSMGAPLSSRTVTVILLVPRSDTAPVTESVAPLTRLTSTTRAMTPMMMPSMVSTARSLLEEMDRMAILKE